MVGGRKTVSLFVSAQRNELLKEDNSDETDEPRRGWLRNAGLLIGGMKGRVLTDRTIHLASPSVLKEARQRANLRNMLYQFVRMYEPHEAREDTILFPAFRKIVSEHEYDALGEEFEKKENQLFHGDGFEKNVDAVAKLEKELGIYDLAQFTPTV